MITCPRCQQEIELIPANLEVWGKWGFLDPVDEPNELDVEVHCWRCTWVGVFGGKNRIGWEKE